MPDLNQDDAIPQRQHQNSHGITELCTLMALNMWVGGYRVSVCTGCGKLYIKDATLIRADGAPLKSGE